MDKLKILPWRCDTCRTVGRLRYKNTVTFKKNSEEAEKDHRKLSPECRESGVRFMNPEKFPARVPKWARKAIKALIS